MTSQAEKCTTLAALHRAGEAWIIPNPWDVGTAVALEEAGFKALATSSSAVAYTLGKKDGEISLEEKLSHCAALAAATTIPVSVDFEDGFADEPEQVAGNIRLLAETGVAGCSIEDYSRQSAKVFDAGLAAERINAAVEAVQGLDCDFQLVARAEGLLRRTSELEEVIERLTAYAASGAHMIYPPGLRSLAQISQVANAVDCPLNVLAPFIASASLAELSDAGATRISLGGALQQACLKTLGAAAVEMLSSGTMGWLSGR